MRLYNAPLHEDRPPLREDRAWHEASDETRAAAAVDRREDDPERCPS